jgi:acetyl/propionyl-CoA carboxylase alpha subunit
VRIVVDGVLRDVQPLREGVRALGPGTFLVERDGRREVFYCTSDGDRVHFHWDGRDYELRLEREGARSASRHAAGGLEAPMPGRVIKLSVALGDEVRRGQELLVVEAMKMENPIRAPHDGWVTRLETAVGEMVGPGQLLVEIE